MNKRLTSGIIAMITLLISIITIASVAGIQEPDKSIDPGYYGGACDEGSCVNDLICVHGVCTRANDPLDGVDDGYIGGACQSDGKCIEGTCYGGICLEDDDPQLPDEEAEEEEESDDEEAEEEEPDADEEEEEDSSDLSGFSEECSYNDAGTDLEDCKIGGQDVNIKNADGSSCIISSATPTCGPRDEDGNLYTYETCVAKFDGEARKRCQDAVYSANYGEKSWTKFTSNFFSSMAEGVSLTRMYCNLGRKNNFFCNMLGGAFGDFMRRIQSGMEWERQICTKRYDGKGKGYLGNPRAPGQPAMTLNAEKYYQGSEISSDKSIIYKITMTIPGQFLCDIEGIDTDNFTGNVNSSDFWHNTEHIMFDVILSGGGTHKTIDWDKDPSTGNKLVMRCDSQGFALGLQTGNMLIRRLHKNYNKICIRFHPVPKAHIESSNKFNIHPYIKQKLDKKEGLLYFCNNIAPADHDINFDEDDYEENPDWLQDGEAGDEGMPNYDGATDADSMGGNIVND